MAVGLGRKQTGVGSVAKITATKVKDITSAAQAVAALFASLNGLIDAFNGRISLGDGSSFSWAGNLDAEEIEYLTPSAPNTEFALPHHLGRVPVRCEVVRKDRACDVFDSSAGSWTDSLVYLKCDTADALVLLRLS